MAVQLYFGRTLGSGAARCADGHLDDKDNGSLRTGCRQPPPLLLAHVRLLAVGSSVNINKLHVTFITFSLGFRGDSVDEGRHAFCLLDKTAKSQPEGWRVGERPSRRGRPDDMGGPWEFLDCNCPLRQINTPCGGSARNC